MNYMQQGAQTPPRVPKLTKPLAEQGIARLLGYDYRVLKFTKLASSPIESMKHACVATGVCKVMKQTTDYYGTPIDYSFCPRCGKVLYYFESMQDHTYFRG